jgi:hypothetical protein
VKEALDRFEWRPARMAAAGSVSEPTDLFPAFTTIRSRTMMRRLISAWSLFLLAVFASAPALAQHSPRLATAPELGAELVLGDDLTSLAAVFQMLLRSTTDARLGLGAADPDDGDVAAFLRTGVRAFVSPRSRNFPFDVAVEGELDVFLGEDNVRLAGGPIFGRGTGQGGLLVTYAQPLFLYTHEAGESDVKLGVRLGADYTMSPVTDLRGDLVISSAMQLRAALYFRPGALLRRGRGPAEEPTPPRSQQGDS